MQVHSHYGGKGSGMVAPAKDIIEFELMEKYGWTPVQIRQIPFKKLQKIFIIQSEKYNAIRDAENSRKASEFAKNALKHKTMAG